MESVGKTEASQSPSPACEPTPWADGTKTKPSEVGLPRNRWAGIVVLNHYFFKYLAAFFQFGVGFNGKPNLGNSPLWMANQLLNSNIEGTTPHYRIPKKAKIDIAKRHIRLASTAFPSSDLAWIVGWWCPQFNISDRNDYALKLNVARIGASCFKSVQKGELWDMTSVLFCVFQLAQEGTKSLAHKYICIF